MPHPWYVVHNAADIPTPALMVYTEHLERNLQLAVKIAGGPQRLRPHVKTHKTAAIVEKMRAAGITKFKCATIAEAEMLARGGVADVMLAFPLFGENARRFGRLCATYHGTRFSTIADSAECARGLSAACVASVTRASVALDVDVGMHRTGVASGDAAVSVYRLLATLPGLIPGGLHCYDGHNHVSSLQERTTTAAGCYDSAQSLKRSLQEHGMEVPLLVMGGTPGFPCYAAYPDVELSPGTCFLQDWGNQRTLPDLPFEPAALVMSRVVSRPGPGKITLDCGSKAIASDPPGERGLPLNLREARTVRQSEEHWVIESPDADNLELGSEVYLLPTHICPTFALYAEVGVVNATGICTENWPVTSRDRSIGL